MWYWLACRMIGRWTFPPFRDLSVSGLRAVGGLWDWVAVPQSHEVSRIFNALVFPRGLTYEREFR